MSSYLDARANGGRWLVRIEDVDGPREVEGSTQRILNTLQAFGFEWDAELIRQRDRSLRYESAIAQLRARGLTFECSCSRTELADEVRYPGTCRVRPLRADAPTATRLRVAEGRIQFTDRIQGTFRQDVGAAVGDIVLRRRDQVFAYVLAVVVDDAEQGVTHVVRGADLLDNTPRQIYLQRLLGLPTPRYAHVPVLTEADGGKLAKSARSIGLHAESAATQLRRVFELLGLAPAAELHDASIAEAWAWAIGRWDVGRVPKRLALHVTGY